MPRWPSLQERLDARLARAPSGCLEWTGPLSNGGYGRISVGSRGTKGRERYVHVLRYELLVGPVPEGLELDHLCVNPKCAEVTHLEPVTHHENLMRGRTIVARAASVTHCPAGHAYDRASVPGLERKCPTCRRDRERARRRALGYKKSGAGCRGLHWRAEANKWRVLLYVDGKRHSNGQYADLEEARRASVELHQRIGIAVHWSLL